MCGIAGIWSPTLPRQERLTIIKTMTDRLVNRGPDDMGAWSPEADGVAFGHRRLAILDLSAGGHQPKTSPSGRFTITFNGEIYNFKDLRGALEQRGRQFATTSDTEVLLVGFEEWGIGETLRRAAGMFAMGVWDDHAKTLTLARDRIGEKPLYYGMVGGSGSSGGGAGSGLFAFASEAEALTAVPGWSPRIDRKSLSLFMRYCYVPAPRCIYSGVRKLEAGCMLTLAGPDLKQAKHERYWSLPQFIDRTLGSGGLYRGTFADASRDLEALLMGVVRQQMLSDVPLGAFLSGGIDSTTVVALMQKVASGPVKTFTIGFSEGEYNEAAHAKAVAGHLGTDHTELYVSPDQTREVIPDLPRIYDEPFADSSQIPTFLVSRMARQHVTVSLSGDGGDEFFGGYTRYHWLEGIAGRLAWLPVPLRVLVGAGISQVPAGAVNQLMAAVSPLLPPSMRITGAGEKAQKLARLLGRTSALEMYCDVLSTWNHPARVVMGGTDDMGWGHLESDGAGLPTLTEAMMMLDALTYLPDDIMAKVDRASMAVSLESRAPFLDHRVVEFAWRLPLAYKIQGTDGKRILKDILARHVPRTLTERPKQGFGIPIGEWLRGPLRSWAEDLLNADRLRRQGYLRPEPIHAVWQEHLRGKYNRTPMIWAVLMFQAWLAEKQLG